MTEKTEKYTRFEKARIIAARALQIAMGAPVFVDVPKGVVESKDVAKLEFEEGVLPLTVLREEEAS